METRAEADEADREDAEGRGTGRRPLLGRTIRAAAALALLGVAAIVVYLAGGPIVTDDLWWHLAMGDVYAHVGPWPAADPFLHTARPDAPIQHEWLFDVIAYGLEQLVGLPGMRVLHALAAAGILALAYATFRRRARCVELACLATVVFALLSWWRLFQLRPDLVSIPATFLLYHLVLAPREPSRGRVAAAVALLVVWANLHSLFGVGLALLLASLLGVGLRVALAKLAALGTGRWPTELRADLARAGRLAACLALGAVASCLNPRGLDQHLTFLHSSRGAAIWRVTGEWSHFDPFDPQGYGNAVDGLAWGTADLVLLAFALAASLALLRFLRRLDRPGLDRLDPVHFGLALAAVVAMLTSIRFLWMSFLPLLFLLRALPEGAARPWCRAAAAAAAVALAVALPMGRSYAAIAQFRPASPGEYLESLYARPKYHAAGVAFLQKTGLEGNLYNDYHMGGFLEYWLAPSTCTFIDGRTEHYSREVMTDYGHIARQRGREAGEGFAGILDERGVDLFFGTAAARTTDHLAGRPGWLLVSRSVHHAIYLRRDPENRRNLQRVARYYAEEDVPFDAARGLDVDRVIRERPAWAAAHEMLPREGAALRAARGAPSPEERFRALEERGLAYALLGAYEAEIALEREALDLRPEAEGPRRRLVHALLRTGRLAQAKRESRALARWHPSDPRAVSAVRRVRRYLRLRTRARQASGEEAAIRAANLLAGFPVVKGDRFLALLDRLPPVALEPRTHAGPRWEAACGARSGAAQGRRPR